MLPSVSSCKNHYLRASFDSLNPLPKLVTDSKVHAFCKQCPCFHKLNTTLQLMSALASLERFGEEDSVFIH